MAGLGGGLNQDDTPIAIGQGQFSVLENFDIRGSHLARRDGMSRVFTMPRNPGSVRITGAPICGLHFFDTGVLLIGCAGRFAVSSGLGAIDLLAPSIPFNLFEAWQMVDNNGVVWAARPSCGDIIRATESGAVAAGLTTPPAPSAAAGAAGLVAAGTYRYRFTYVTDKGDESAASPAVEVVLGADSEVDLSGLTAAAETRVVSKNIYRTLRNDDGAWWLVDTIDNATTTYTDNVTNSELGDQLDDEVFAVPDAISGIAKWQERLWAHDTVKLYCTKVGQFETFIEEFDAFDARGDREVTAIHPWDSRLMVATTEQVFQLSETGVDEQGIRYTVSVFSSDTGCVARMSMKSAGGKLFWLARDGVYMSDGGAPRRISDNILKTFLEWASPAYIGYSTAYIDAENGEYCLTVGAGRTGGQMVYNWTKGTWTTRIYTDDSAGEASPGVCGPLAHAEKDGITYLAFVYGFNVYQVERTAPASWIDRGVSEHRIEAIARMKAIREPGARTGLRKVYLHVTGRAADGGDAPAPAEDMTVRLYQDGEQTACREATIRLDDEPNRTLKRIGLGTKASNWRPLCNSFEVEVAYEGQEPIDINEAHFERDLFGIDGRSL